MRARYREYWIIDKFDEEPSLPVHNVREEVELYPAFRDKLRVLNRVAATLVTFLLTIFIMCAARRARQASASL